MDLQRPGCQPHTVYLLWCLLLPSVSECFMVSAGRQRRHVPDEQRLYEHLMTDYEECVRPVFNASEPLHIDFKLTLNQIVDLDERKQVLTTNVFIDQVWTDENLQWNPDEYNGIRNLRVPASHVWLPDTFVFNNADDGSTGFMQGVYVLINSNGSVLWPVPVKLKSSCKVDIAYFPFDDQICRLRFGSWMYSNETMEFSSSLAKVDMTHYIDNSEWELRAIKFQRRDDHYSACCPQFQQPHPDLTFTLHIRRRTFYYIWNIIVPCIMLSVLTLLTFWLPPTSGEKISLGLSVFLAFSMFMLLIAEEVPATSESVPLIGVYLTTVMTMTSMSVIMAVMVINLYNRSSKARRAPQWMKSFFLVWMCKLLRMTHDIERLAQSIRLEEDEELRYRCNVHDNRMRRLSTVLPHHSRRDRCLEYAQLLLQQQSFAHAQGEGPHPTAQPQLDPAPNAHAFNGALTSPDRPRHREWRELKRRGVFEGTQSGLHFNGPSSERFPRSGNANIPSSPERHPGEANEEEEPIWQMREEYEKKQTTRLTSNDLEQNSARTEADDNIHNQMPWAWTEHLRRVYSQRAPSKKRKTNEPARSNSSECDKEMKYSWRKEMVVEWQTIATVVDRCLFWLFLVITIVTYVVMLIVTPYTKPSHAEDATPIHVLRGQSSAGHQTWRDVT